MGTKALRIGVLGSTGFGGSYLCVELINRGHHVVGLSRNPEKLGQHERYQSRKIDLGEAPVEELVNAFHGLDVIVNEYGPHSAGEQALKYSTCYADPRAVPQLIPGRALSRIDTQDNTCSQSS